MGESPLSLGVLPAGAGLSCLIQGRFSLLGLPRGCRRAPGPEGALRFFLTETWTQAGADAMGYARGRDPNASGTRDSSPEPFQLPLGGGWEPLLPAVPSFPSFPVPAAETPGRRGGRLR